MKVLTLREPWASLIGENIKKIETRSWFTHYRGELYIHAGLTKIPPNDARMNRLAKELTGAFHFGTIFAKCNLVDCVKIDEAFANSVKESDFLCYDCGDYTPGRYAWILEDIELIEPITATGKLGLWNYSMQCDNT
ncbi:MAG: ASCH domain-containing protein [Lachnospiraceae bacterium]|nr:ASCH domain-containing protein [Lachnospiraceae bacterium]